MEMYTIKTYNLEKKFGTLKAITDINLKVSEGELFCLCGPNGAGKTTLLKILTAQINPTKGSAKVLGLNVVEKPLEVKSKIGIVPEIEGPPSYLTLYEYLYFVGRLRNLENIDEKINYWVDFFSLRGKERTLCKDLSRGMRQRLIISAALIHKPKILFLDEPLANLDPLSQKIVKDYLTEFVKNGGTVFLCTHMLEVAEKLCSRIAIINNGKIVIEGKLEDLKKNGKETLEDLFLRTVASVPPVLRERWDAK